MAVDGDAVASAGECQRTRPADVAAGPADQCGLSHRFSFQKRLSQAISSDSL
jgi:hypothetical protein